MRKVKNLSYIVALVAALWGMFASPAMAQVTYKQDKIWGTSPSGLAPSGAAESQQAHYYGGLVAGQVKAANMNVLFTTAYTQNIYAVGVMNNNSINGSYNALNSGQSGTTNGNTTNKGTNSLSGPGNNIFNPF